jgi:hypothetical protein
VKYFCGDAAAVLIPGASLALRVGGEIFQVPLLLTNPNMLAEATFHPWAGLVVPNGLLAAGAEEDQNFTAAPCLQLLVRQALKKLQQIRSVQFDVHWLVHHIDTFIYSCSINDYVGLGCMCVAYVSFRNIQIQIEPDTDFGVNSQS